MEYNYRDYNAEKRTKTLSLVGAVLGGVAGVALPFYAGWEMGNYIQNAENLSYLMGFGIKTLTASGLTAMVANRTIPLGVVGGMVVAGITDITTSIGGELVQGTAHQIKESLVKRVS